MFPTLFLTTAGESDLLVAPQECRISKRLRGPNRDDYAIVELRPGARGLIPDSDGFRWIIASRSAGFSMFPPNFPPPTWPIDVYLVAVRSGVRWFHSGEFGLDDIIDCGKAIVLPSRTAADAWVRNWRPDFKG